MHRFAMANFTSWPLFCSKGFTAQLATNSRLPLLTKLLNSSDSCSNFCSDSGFASKINVINQN